ncbi:unnamed protein product, partial [Phaeothamnion confervicola]
PTVPASSSSGSSEKTRVYVGNLSWATEWQASRCSRACRRHISCDVSPRPSGVCHLRVGIVTFSQRGHILLFSLLRFKARWCWVGEHRTGICLASGYMDPCALTGADRRRTVLHSYARAFADGATLFNVSPPELLLTGTGLGVVGKHIETTRLASLPDPNETQGRLAAFPTATVDGNAVGDISRATCLFVPPPPLCPWL